jgi:hypothetical protein
MRYGTIWVLVIVLMLAAASTLTLPSNGAASGDSGGPIPLGTDHAVFGEVKTNGGHPPDGTLVKVTVCHSGSYTEYPVTGGIMGGWYSKTLPGTQQGMNWDIGDNIWVNVTYSGSTYYNKTIITSGTNQQIDVSLYGSDHAVWGRVIGPCGSNISDGTPVSVVVFHIDHFTTYNVTGGTSACYYTKTLPGSDYGINWQPGDAVWVKVSYLKSESSNSSFITDVTNQQIDVQVLVKIPLIAGWNLISLPLVQANTSIPIALSSITGQWDVVKYYDAIDVYDPWKTYRVGSTVNDLWNLDHTMGFWLHATQNTNLTVYGALLMNTSITLKAGWNLVGYPSLINRTASLALAGTGSDIITIFDGASLSYMQDIMDLSTVIMEPGEGYWVHVPADTTWVVDW